MSSVRICAGLLLTIALPAFLFTSHVESTKIECGLTGFCKVWYEPSLVNILFVMKYCLYTFKAFVLQTETMNDIWLCWNLCKSNPNCKWFSFGQSFQPMSRDWCKFWICHKPGWMWLCNYHYNNNNNYNNYNHNNNA